MSNRHFFSFPKTSDFKSQSGQIAVIVFLIMAVLLVVGLSLATRTSQEIELAGQQEDTTRVFNAAETGIEEALSQSSNFTGAAPAPQTTNDSTTQTSRTVTIEPESGFEGTFQSGETATVFTNTSGAAQNMTLSWTRDTEAECSSVLVVTVYTNSNQALNYGLRPPGACFVGTQFTPITGGASGGYRYTHTLQVPANTVMLRIKPLYASTWIRVEGNLAAQNHNIRSQAQDTAAGNTEVRAIEVTRSRPAPPAILDYALYSGDDLVKN